MDSYTSVDPTTCEHDWKPITGWMGRYKCEHCHIIGYKVLVTASTSDNDDTVHSGFNKPRLYNGKATSIPLQEGHGKKRR